MKVPSVSVLLVFWLLLGATANTQDLKISKQYKRVHQNALKAIMAGETSAAETMLRAFLDEWPDDAESYYMLTVAYAQAGRTQAAIESAKRAIELGLPAERFVAGTKTLLEPLADTEFITGLRRRCAYTPLHGPMLGDMTADRVSIWLRTLRAAQVRAVISRSADMADPVSTPPVVTAPATDFTAVVTIDGLEPSTDYYYRVEIDGHRCETHPPRQLRTFPAQNQPAKFRLVFGGGAGYVPPNERVWHTIQKQAPDLLLLLGDNVYSDDPTTPEMQHYCYYRRQSRPEFRQLVQSTPVYSIWDDHDFGTNDCVEGPLIDTPTWKRPVFQVFRNNWVNPGYGGGDEHPGCYYDYYVGDVHFIMLDGRFYRTLEPDQGGPTMLGPVQRAWLLDKVAHSRGRLMLLCSPVPWVYEAKGDSKDTWNGFRAERQQIFDQLAECNKDGVVLMSADRHRSDLWKIERENDYPLYEFSSSRLTNQHVHKTMEQAEFSYHAKQSFGVVDIDTTQEDPLITYRIMTIDGDEVYKFDLRRSQISHP